LVYLFLAAVAILFVSPWFGVNEIRWTDIFSKMSSESREGSIFWKMRLPRVIMGFTAGAIFALGGMVFQALFRNPLVSPFTLGVTSGASLGAALYIYLGISFALFGLSGISYFAFIGALISVWVVWVLARAKANASTSTILLAGVAVSFFFSSLIMFIQYLSGVNQSVKISRWLMGGFYTFGYGEVMNLIPIALIGLLVIWYFSYDLNLLTTGEDFAKSRGVSTSYVLYFLIIFVSFLIGVVVSLCGPIAFIGIVAPHVCRFFIGSNHRHLTIATFLVGGSFLVLCDALARLVIAPAEMPVGVITALIGGPFFVWLLVRTKDAETVGL
jgi:iron complex transport system permease protein